MNLRLCSLNYSVQKALKSLESRHCPCAVNSHIFYWLLMICYWWPTSGHPFVVKFKTFAWEILYNEKSCEGSLDESRN